MAQTILTLCDRHLLDDDAQVVGEEWRFGIAAPGEKWEWHAIDMCMEHGSELALAVELLRKYGRAEKAPAPRATAPRAYTPREAVDGSWPCDFCDRVFPRKQGVSMHMTRTHTAEKAAAEQAAAIPDETPQERRNRLDRERKARKRAAAQA